MFKHLRSTHFLGGLNLSWTRQCSRRRWWHSTPVLLPGKSRGRKSLVGYSPCGREESDATKWPHFDFSFSCIGEGNDNPLQCSCLENPRDGGAGGLPSMGSHRVGHYWRDLAAAGSAMFSMQPLKSQMHGLFFFFDLRNAKDAGLDKLLLCFPADVMVWISSSAFI